MATTAEKKKDLETALQGLEAYRDEIVSGNALFIISTEYGKGDTDFLKVQLAYQNSKSEIELAHLTWHCAKAFGYRLKDRNGRWYLALGGGNYSKSYDIALTLGQYYYKSNSLAVRYRDN